MQNPASARIGFLFFPGMLQLDFTGAYGVLAAGPNAEIHLVWKNVTPVLSSDGLSFAPNTAMADCPPLDVLIVPGGSGVLPLLDDNAVLSFLRGQSRTAKYTASVCTGALVLGAAGLLAGFRATTHWLSWDMLTHFGAIPEKKRVVLDRNRLTAAGVSSGIDMALLLAGLLWGDAAAMEIQLNMEYAPEPPYAAGSPETAAPPVARRLRERNAARQAERLAAVIKAAKRLAR